MTESGGQKAPERSAGANLMGLGALVLVGGYLLFELILDEYSTGSLTMLFAAWILALVWMGTDSWGGIPVNTALRFAGYSLTLLGVYFLLNDLRGGFVDGIDILGAIVYYGGIVIVFLGARSLPKSA
jgi:hypothetical protein